MNDKPPIPAIKLVSTDIVCRFCGYNLRTLAVDSRCPECGESITLSLRGDYLPAANPAWLRAISFAALLDIVNILIYWVVFSYGVSTLWLGMPKSVPISWVTYTCTAILLPTIYLVAIWQYTKAPPSPQPQMPAARLFMRVSALLYLGASAIIFLMLASRGYFIAFGLYSLMNYVLIFVHPVRHALRGLFLWSVASRIPSPSQSRAWAWIASLEFMAMVVLGAIKLMVTRRESSELVALVSLACVPLQIWSVFLLVFLRRAIAPAVMTAQIL